MIERERERERIGRECESKKNDVNTEINTWRGNTGEDKTTSKKK